MWKECEHDFIIILHPVLFSRHIYVHITIICICILISYYYYYYCYYYYHTMRNMYHRYSDSKC